MKSFALVASVLLLVVPQWSAAFSAYGRPEAGGYSSGYSSSSYAQSSSHSSSSSSSLDSAECCQMNNWAYQHMDEVRQFANRLRQEYNQMSAGSTTSYGAIPSYPWKENIIQLSGMTSGELDALCRRISEQLVTDMRKGQISYSTIAQPNYFQWRAAQALESRVATDNDFGQQQQQQLLDIGHYEPVDITNFDEVKNYAYPTEVKVIDGRTYVVHKNCTEATQTIGDGSYSNPLVSVIKRNRTIITTNTLPSYSPYGGSDYTSGSLISGNQQTTAGGYPGIYVQPGSSQGSSITTITRKKTISDYINENMEPMVVGYKPRVDLNSNWPPVRIPVDSSKSEVETFGSSSGYGSTYQPTYTPGSSTWTIHRYNKTVITNPDGTNSVSGSEENKKYVDGKLVYDTRRPFGTWSVPRDEAWKRDERERFFWFLSQGAATPERLVAWQRQQEERLLAVADRYHTTLEEIQEFHRKELERYNVLQLQYQKQSNYVKAWERMECSRLDWLIHQNSVTREELERWQRENKDKLAQLARQYRISLDELLQWQVNELNRLYVVFNDQNNSMIPVNTPSSDSLTVDEQARLEELIRQHNATIAQLQNSIQTDQQKLVELTQTYRGDVKDMSQWLKNEIAKLGGIISEQRNEMTRITTWQNNERSRLEQMLKEHRGSVGDLEQQIERDRAYIRGLAAKYHVSIDELEKWQRAELERLQNENQAKLELDVKAWQARERANLKSIVQKNDLTIEEFQKAVISDRQRLQELARTYKMEVEEVEEWFRQEIKNLQDQGLLKEVKEQLLLWQQKERERLQKIVQQHALTVEELEVKIKKDQSYLYDMANNYHVRVEELEEWLKKELQRLQSQGLVKTEELKDWQTQERAEILKLLQANHLTIEEFEQKLLADKQRLTELAQNYNVQTTELESWIRKEGERLQSAGLLQMQEQLNNWQKIERERLVNLINKNNLSMEELQEKIKKDQVHLYSLAHQHQVRVEDIEEWIKQEIKKLQQQGLLDMQELKNWQTEWRGNLTDMVKERDFTVEEFHKWLLEDRSRLQAMAMQHNVQIEELEQWIKNEEQRFVSMGLLKPNEKLTDWQTVERRYLERITQQQYKSTEQLEQRLRQDRELLEQLARQYRVQVQEIEEWMKKELARLRDDGQLQIDNLTAWQIAERERLEALTKQNKQWSVEEFEAELRKDRDHMQRTAFQYHTSVEEIEKWIAEEVARLQQQGKLNIEQLTVWQQQERARILQLLQQQSSITAEEFEQKLQNDRRFLVSIAQQYHVTVDEVESYVRRVVDELREKGKFELEKLKSWQLVERDYIKQILAQYNNELSTKEYEQKLLADRVHISQLADHYHLSVQEIEQWMLAELQRLRKNSGDQLEQLAAWQRTEVERLKQLIKKNQHISYVEFEIELMKERGRLQALSEQYSVSVAEIENWLRQQLVNLRTTGEIQVESLTKWQEEEQKNLIGNLLQEQSYEKLEEQLRRDRAHLQQLATQYSVSVEEIESWMQNEIKRLKSSGLIEVEQLNYWQQHERDRLADWLKQQHNQATYEDFEEFIKRDKSRLQQIAQEYRVTVEEVETWVQKEGARLQILGALQRPQNYVYHNEYEHTWQTQDNNQQSYPVTNSESDWNMWQTQTRAHLQAIAQVQPLSMTSFEEYLVKERPRWEQFARQYHITVEEIENWLRQSAKELQQQGLIHGTITVEEWQIDEQAHIQNLINERLRKQQQWSIEELERLLRNDRQHLNQVAQQYHITVEELTEWYKQELQRLLDQRKILSEYLVDWQRREKERIYNIVVRRPGVTLTEIEAQLLRDKATLKRLADEYRVQIEELEYWIRNELKRLVNLGLVSDLSTTSNYNMWQQQERERLRNIVAEITITEEELISFIANDNAYQQQLARLYGCSLDQLAPFQRIEASVMQREGLFDKTELLKLEMWQQRERDRLFGLIRTQNFSLKNLRDWQKRDSFIVDLASKYGITVQAFKDWQMKTYTDLMKLAEHYKMTLSHLQDFRDKELRYITYVMHKKTSTEAERIQWGANEAKRMAVLERRTGLSGEDLLEWRRKLYLYSQGLLPFNFDGGFGGYESGIGSTNYTAKPHQLISKDRGDQPPNVYDENADLDEPGLAGNTPPAMPPSQPLVIEPTVRPSRPAYGGPQNSGVESGYRYSKKEYKFTVPVGVASASAAADSSGSQAQASVGIGPYRGSTNFNGMSTASLTTDAEQHEDFGQQQQVELGWNGKLEQSGDDLGQQQQVDLGWNGKLQTEADLGQQQQVELNWNGKLQNEGQQVQVEDLSGYTAQGGYQQQREESGNYAGGQQQQQEHEVFYSGSNSQSYGHTQLASEKQIAATPATIEVQAETEPTGFWGKIKQKTNSIFG